MLTEAVKSKIYTISELNLEAKLLLESNFLKIWVCGEISNLSCPSSGHIYFSLKDQNTQVRCAMFRLQKNLLLFQPENGMQVLVQAKVSLYEGRGDYQLIVDYMEPQGDGLLLQAFERLKAKLLTEGLFDEKFKKALPRLPKTIGVITSKTGAALQDILNTLNRRFPAIKVIVYATEVQGKTAAASIVNAIVRAENHAACDVIIIARGGGSLEDLQAFNDEAVARAIFACSIPTVSGVGHEIDTTIVDYVVDRRAATPTAAAELVSPDQQEWLLQIQRHFDRLNHVIRTILNSKSQTLDYLAKQLRHPKQQIAEKKERLQALFHRLNQSQERYLTLKMTELSALSRALNLVSPLTILDRGFAIVSKQNGEIIREAKQVVKGEKLAVQFADDKIICEVISLDS